MPCFFVFPHGTAEDGAGIAGQLALWRAVWRGAGLILLRSRCVAFGDRATELWAGSPRDGSGVRTWSVWLQLGFLSSGRSALLRRICDLRRIWLRDLYTRRLVPTPSTRLAGLHPGGLLATHRPDRDLLSISPGGTGPCARLGGTVIPMNLRYLGGSSGSLSAAPPGN